MSSAVKIQLLSSKVRSHPAENLDLNIEMQEYCLLGGLATKIEYVISKGSKMVPHAQIFIKIQSWRNSGGETPSQRS